MRPVLRPGTHVLRRGTGEVQVGLDPGSAIVLPDTAPVRASLRLLAASADLAAYDDRATVRLLAEHDLLIDVGDLHPLLGAGPAPQTVAALARSAGAAAPDVHAARRSSRTRTAVFGAPPARPCARSSWP